ncbi:glycosyltransferase family 2 protein [Gymnodinialimonas sp. 2305UL16-5]|uniref:glycosyltransferase family 2 protein n=1 Tax=Gymnodinialimonas mytili TaxID=3126503 RepID=UPI0030A4E83D
MQHLKHNSKHGTVLAVSMMKDEAPFLLEWVAHHLALGFTDILVYTNDCTDGTDEMLIRLEELGLAHHRRNIIPDGVKPQPSAIKHAQVEPIVQNADWVLLFDADEFLCIRHPAQHLEGLLDDVVARGANGLVITWRIFGSAGVVEWSRAPVTEQYLRAAPPLWNKGWGVKTLFKFDATYWKLGIHRPSIKNKWLETEFPDSVHWLNGSGAPMEDYFKFRGWRSIRRTIGYDWVQMNHYAVKSIDSYAMRKLRGNVNNKADKYNADYWALQDRNEVEDRTVLAHAASRTRIMDALLTDPVLNRLHVAALDRVEARLAAYKTTDAYAALRDGLITAGAVPITQVAAKPPKARDPAKIAALMSRVEQQAVAKSADARRDDPIPGWAGENGDPYMPAPIDLSDDLAVDWVPNHDIDLPADLRLFTPDALEAVIAGRFDRRHARNLAGYLDGCTRVLELGAGIGFVAQRAVRLSDQLTYMAHDSRADLIAAGRQIAARLGETARLKLFDGPLSVDGRPTGLQAYVIDFKPDCLRLGRISELPPSWIAQLDLSPVARIVIPVLSARDAQSVHAAYGPALADQGFIAAPDRAGSGSLQFDRTPRSGDASR